jgi:hypothetical protein
MLLSSNFRSRLRSKFVLPPLAITPRGFITMPNPFVHIELNSTDVDQAKKFQTPSGWSAIFSEG